MTAWGRVLGDHHLGTGALAQVDHLKGANMSVRKSVLALPKGLPRRWGRSLPTNLAVSLRRWRARPARIVYEPAAIVDHHPAERFDDDGREHRTATAIEDAAYNQSYVVMSLRPAVRRRRLLYQLAVGERWSPGVVRAAVALGRREREVLRSVAPAMRAQARAFRDSRRRPLVTRAPRRHDRVEAS